MKIHFNKNFEMDSASFVALSVQILIVTFAMVINEISIHNL